MLSHRDKDVRVGQQIKERPVVLVVEDEFLVRMDAVMVRAAGFDAVEASDADEAIDILTSRLDIAVVFTDIQMPVLWMA
jgi:CheY-like chemotaxis protein